MEDHIARAGQYCVPQYIVCRITADVGLERFHCIYVDLGTRTANEHNECSGSQYSGAPLVMHH